MGQLLVRKIDDDLKRRLKERAERDGVSMEEEARMILQAALLKDAGGGRGLGSEIAALFREFDLKEGELEPLPWEPFEPVKFDDDSA